MLIVALLNKDPEGYGKAIGLLKHVEGLPLYAPRVIEVELIAVSRRLGYKSEREKLLRLTRRLTH